jgi:hypothetical protein
MRFDPTQKKLRSFSRAGMGGAFVLSLLAPACGGNADVGAEAEAVATDESALDGRATFPDATCAGMEEQILHGLRRARTQLVGVEAATLSACVKDAFLSGTDSFPELIFKEMAEETPTTVTCGSLGTADWSAPASIDGESIKLDKTFAWNATERELASAILTAVAVNHGFYLPPAGSRERPFSVPEQLGACSASIVASPTPPPALPNGPRRSTLLPETTLAPTGGMGGQPFRWSCGTSSVTTGLRLRTGLRVDAFGLVCGDVNNRYIVPSNPFGGTGGVDVVAKCEPSEVVVGLRGRASRVNDAIAPICANEIDVRDGRTAILQRRGSLLGGTGGEYYERICPDGMMLRGVTGRYASSVDRLQVECQRYTQNQSTHRYDAEKAGGSGGVIALEECPARSVLVGLTYQAGSHLDRLGGTCAPIVNGVIGAARYPLASHGGTGGAAGAKDCLSGKAIVSLKVRAGSAIDDVGGICQRVGNSNDRDTLPSALGTAETPLGCPSGQYLTGWWIGSGSRVDSLQPICRTL